MSVHAREHWKTCLHSDILMFYLKSGMPVEVLIPAPEWTTKYWDSFISLARVSTLERSSSGLSNTCHKIETSVRRRLRWEMGGVGFEMVYDAESRQQMSKNIIYYLDDPISATT